MLGIPFVELIGRFMAPAHRRIGVPAPRRAMKLAAS
jgi:hypothetical protein